MPSRYYFLSSLPMLRFSDASPMKWEDFISQAVGNVSEQDLRLLEGIVDGKDGGNGFLIRWADFNAKLDDAVNTRRRQILGRQGEESLILRDPEFEQTANAALNAKNPLEAEILLMQCRFDYLENAKGFDPFSESALLAYALQLRILLRKAMFNSEMGNSEYRKLFEKLQNELKTE